jgi:hypothetical protein
MNSKTYAINGKKIIHRPLSPMQLIRISAIWTELEEMVKRFVKNGMPSIEQTNDGVNIDMTIVYELLQELEKNNPAIIVRLINTIFIDAASGKPCYVDNVLTIDDFYAIDAPTFLEVVADFFTINDVSKTYSMLSDLRKKMTPNLDASLTPQASAQEAGNTTGLNS